MFHTSWGQKSSDHLCNDIPLTSSFPVQGTALQKMIYQQQPDTPAARGSALNKKQETEQFYIQCANNH